MGFIDKVKQLFTGKRHESSGSDRPADGLDTTAGGLHIDDPHTVAGIEAKTAIETDQMPGTPRT